MKDVNDKDGLVLTESIHLEKLHVGKRGNGLNSNQINIIKLSFGLRGLFVIKASHEKSLDYNL